MTLDGRVAVVTGAAGGLGAAVADRLAADGAAVERIDLEGDGRRLDVRDHAAVAAAFAQIGRIDVLVNCAGIREIVPVLELSAEEWQRVIDVNLGGTFNCSQAAARTMAAAGGGSIVNVASTSALAADPSRTAYCASKAGILGLTRAMALDLGPRGVRVNAVCPGLVRTPLTESLLRRPGVRRGAGGRLAAGPRGRSRRDRRRRRLPGGRRRPARHRRRAAGGRWLPGRQVVGRRRLRGTPPRDQTRPRRGRSGSP